MIIYDLLFEKTMKRTLFILLVVLLAGPPLSAQQLSSVLSGFKPVQDPFNKENRTENFGLAVGARYTMGLGERFGIGVGASHEWRSIKVDQETPAGTVPLNEVEGRAFLVQFTGIYDLPTCASACGTKLGVMVGTDVTLPYRTNTLRFETDGSEVALGANGRAFTAGLAVRAGLRISMPLCEYMGLYMEPQAMYKAVLDRTDQAAFEGRTDSKLGDRMSIAIQGGMYITLGSCPMKRTPVE